MIRRSWILALAAGACAGAPDGMDDLLVPDRTAFPLVADALQPRCGTLDCHGQGGRNLRLWGARGLRLAEADTPDDGRTTAAEYEASYWSVVGLEPERLSEVLADGGRRPTRLSLIQKPRGGAAHKGGRLMRVGDDLDRCLTSWLRSPLDTRACRAIADADRPHF